MSRKRSIQGIFSAAINFPQNESCTVKIYAQIYLQTPADLKSAGNGNVIHDRFQVLRVHVILVAPLGARHMAKPCADQHQSRVTVRETTHHTGAAADLPVQPLNDIVGTDARPVFAGKIAVGKSLLMPSSTFLAASFSFMERSSSTTALAFCRAAFLLSWAWMGP